LRPVLDVRQRHPVRRRRDRSLGADPGAAVDLHANEAVAGRRGQELVLHGRPVRGHLLVGALLRDPLLADQRHPGRR
jgi:hypothetical protein